MFYAQTEFLPATSPGYLARRIHQLSTVALEPVFVGEGMTATQWSALAGIAVGGCDTCAAVAREVGHDTGAMTRVLDQLEARGWITRSRDADDRRVVKLAVTADGMEAAIRCKRKLQARWNEWLSDWTDDEVRDLVLKLSRLKTRIEADA